VTAAVPTPTVARVSHVEMPDARLRFTGILRSEWIKLTTLRSTIWTLAVLVLLQIGMGVVAANTLFIPEGAEASAEAATRYAVFAATIGVFLNQLVIAVLGVLVISGEYSTGQIRSTLAAVPSRVPVLLAKALVFGVTAFVISLASILLTYGATWFTIDSLAGPTSLADPAVLWPLIGAAGYLALVGLLAFAIGAIVRHTAAGIAVSVGLLLVIPTVLSLISADWATVLTDWLPSRVGQVLFDMNSVFEPWQAVLIMLGWVAVPFTAAAALLSRRDA
jgi:ABC-2 type transport system permease protein